MNITAEAKEQLLDPVDGRKIFSTMIDGKKMWVYRRNEEHQDGERNGTPNNWWLKYDRSDGYYDWVPWVDKLTKRPCFEIKIREGNHMKYKWDEWNIKGGVYCEIILNGEKVYEFRARDIEYVMAKATVLKNQILEHPFDFTNPDEMVGRKVYYREQPAIVERVILDQGCVILKKDGTGNFSKPAYWDDEMDWEEESTVKEEIFSDHIWWFRD